MSTVSENRNVPPSFRRRGENNVISRAFCFSSWSVERIRKKKQYYCYKKKKVVRIFIFYFQIKLIIRIRKNSITVIKKKGYFFYFQIKLIIKIKKSKKNCSNTRPPTPKGNLFPCRRLVSCAQDTDAAAVTGIWHHARASFDCVPSARASARPSSYIYSHLDTKYTDSNHHLPRNHYLYQLYIKN